PDSFGGIRFIAGTYSPPVDSSGGSSASALRSRFSIWCDSTISAALNLTGGSRRRNNSPSRALGQRAGRRVSVGNAERFWRTADGGGEPRRHHSAGGGTAAAVRSAGHESVAIRIWHRSAGSIVSST